MRRPYSSLAAASGRRSWPGGFGPRIGCLVRGRRPSSFGTGRQRGRPPASFGTPGRQRGKGGRPSHDRFPVEPLRCRLRPAAKWSGGWHSGLSAKVPLPPDRPTGSTRSALPEPARLHEAPGGVPRDTVMVSRPSHLAPLILGAARLRHDRFVAPAKSICGRMVEGRRRSGSPFAAVSG